MEGRGGAWRGMDGHGWAWMGMDGHGWGMAPEIQQILAIDYRKHPRFCSLSVSKSIATVQYKRQMSG